MNEEVTMRAFDPKHPTVDVNDVEVEDVIEQERQRQRREAEQVRAEESACANEQAEPVKGESDDSVERDFLEFLMKRDRERAAQARREKREHLTAAAVFALAACVLVAGMFYDLVSPVLALPLALAYLMRCAVRFDRFRRE